MAFVFWSCAEWKKAPLCVCVCLQYTAGGLAPSRPDGCWMQSRQHQAGANDYKASSVTAAKAAPGGMALLSSTAAATHITPIHPESQPCRQGTLLYQVQSAFRWVFLFSLTYKEYIGQMIKMKYLLPFQSNLHMHTNFLCFSAILPAPAIFYKEINLKKPRSHSRNSFIRTVPLKLNKRCWIGR